MVWPANFRLDNYRDYLRNRLRRRQAQPVEFYNMPLSVNRMIDVGVSHAIMLSVGETFAGTR